LEVGQLLFRVDEGVEALAEGGLLVEDLAGLLVVVPETGGADDDLQFGEAAVYVGDVKETSAGASVSRPRWRAGTWSSRTYGGAG
jgi:hypothetical protein